MRFDPRFLDDIRARLPVSHVVGRKVALKKKGREFAGLSPFKAEKTASFFVNDQKGFYHCFASGEHGDIFTFLIKTEGLSFPEAVERLAAEAGVPMPVETRRDPERENRRQRLYDLMEETAAYFQRQLAINTGRDARQYLEGRQLKPETIAEFRIGYAPNSRTALKEHLAQQGFTPEEMATAGTLIAGEDIQTPYDRFRNRVMFPIGDAKGRIVAFGGRALSPDQPAKYLNSPETPLFHKGGLLFNAHRARQAAFETQSVLVVEGYMDVIALAQAGYANAVAPLGTALTADQLELLWRMAPEPSLCFDGDEAGRKAAHRAVDTAVPHLRSGNSLRFVFLPDGLDPDDLIRQRGAAALHGILETAKPLVDVLWEREWGRGEWTTPERRAAFESSLRELVRSIQDPGIRAHYGQVFKDRLYHTWRNQTRSSYISFKRQPNQEVDWRRHGASQKQGRKRPDGRFDNQHTARSSSLRQSVMVMSADQGIPSREALLLRTLLNHPWLMEDHAEEIADIAFTSPTAERLRTAIETLCVTENDLDNQSLRAQLENLRLGSDIELVERVSTHKSDKFAELGADRAEVEAGWHHTLALHKQQVLRDQLASAEADFRRTGDDDAMSRIIEIQRLIATSELIEAEQDERMHPAGMANGLGRPD